jgi:hypothetical protein
MKKIKRDGETDQKERIHKNSTTYFAHKHVFVFFKSFAILLFILSDKKRSNWTKPETCRYCQSLKRGQLHFYTFIWFGLCASYCWKKKKFRMSKTDLIWTEKLFVSKLLTFSWILFMSKKNIRQHQFWF